MNVPVFIDIGPDEQAEELRAYFKSQVRSQEDNKLIERRGGVSCKPSFVAKEAGRGQNEFSNTN